MVRRKTADQSKDIVSGVCVFEHQVSVRGEGGVRVGWVNGMSNSYADRSTEKQTL